MWERLIIHSQIHNCYCQIEEMMHPYLKSKAMVVEEKGIVISANDIAKMYGIDEGERLNDSYQKCPQLLSVQAHYEDYDYYIEEINNIYREYSDVVEAFCSHETWIDMSFSQGLFNDDPLEIANQIHQQIYDDLGLKVSLGISFNKVYAKIANCINDDKYVHVVSYHNYKRIAKIINVEKLFYINYKQSSLLKKNGIYTFDDLCKTHIDFLKSILGYEAIEIFSLSQGEEIYLNKKEKNDKRTKSIGNSLTACYNIESLEETLEIISILSKKVAKRLTDYGLKGSCISIHLRNNNLYHFVKSKKLSIVTNDEQIIRKIVEDMIMESCVQSNGILLIEAYNTLSIKVSQLIENEELDKQNFYHVHLSHTEENLPFSFLRKGYQIFAKGLFQ